MVNDLIEELPRLISESDTHVSQLALMIVSRLSETMPQSMDKVCFCVCLSECLFDCVFLFVCVCLYMSVRLCACLYALHVCLIVFTYISMRLLKDVFVYMFVC